MRSSVASLARHLLLFGSLFALGCIPARGQGGDDDGGLPPDGGAMNKPGVITISPNPIEVVVNGGDQTVKLTARSNTYGDVTRRVTWVLSDPGLGFVQGGALTVRGGLDHGGTAIITASLGIQIGKANLHVKLVAPDLVDPSAPANPQTYFDNGDGGPKPSWVYPFPNTMLPRNQAQMNLQWNGASGAQAYRIQISGDTFAQNIYVGPGVCGGSTQCKFQPADASWTSIARSAAGNDATLVLSASAGAGQKSGSADPFGVSFSPEDVKGGLYYWSTTITGIYRVPIGAKTAQVFIRSGNEFGCSGCHAVSRDGKKVALEFGSANGVGGGVVDGTSGTKYLIKPPSAGQWNLQTFSPKGDMLMVNWQGHAKVINPDNGMLITDVPQNVVGGRLAQPEWSPDGNSIVFVRYPAEGSGDEWMASNTGDVMVLPWNGGMFGPPQMIVQSKPNVEYHFYPSWTPDSKWIVFNTGTVPCGGFGGGGCNNYNAQNTRLRIVRAAAGQTPVELTRATHLLHSTTNWPRVAPFIQNSGKLVFFTFSANFPYGFVKPQQNPQVWMAGVDLDKAITQPDQDPSFSPFWLPFQNPSENNHLATWTTDVACNGNPDCPAEFNCIGNVCVPNIG